MQFSIFSLKEAGIESLSKLFLAAGLELDKFLLSNRCEVTMVNVEKVSWLVSEIFPSDQSTSIDPSLTALFVKSLRSGEYITQEAHTNPEFFVALNILKRELQSPRDLSDDELRKLMGLMAIFCMYSTSMNLG